MHFTLHNEIYAKNDRVAMDSFLGSILANVFMVGFGNLLVSRLHQHLQK